MIDKKSDFWMQFLLWGITFELFSVHFYMTLVGTLLLIVGLYFMRYDFIYFRTGLTLTVIYLIIQILGYYLYGANNAFRLLQDPSFYSDRRELFNMLGKLLEIPIYYCVITGIGFEVDEIIPGYKDNCMDGKFRLYILATICFLTMRYLGTLVHMGVLESIVIMVVSFLPQNDGAGFSTLSFAFMTFLVLQWVFYFRIVVSISKAKRIIVFRYLRSYYGYDSTVTGA